jgi:AcrR family transcriptional regulator
MRRKEGDKGGDILRAAVRVFARDGFDEAKVTAIALEAKVATGSVYLYFTGKDDILDALFREFWVNLREGLTKIDVADPLERIRRQLVLFYDRLVADRSLAVVYLRDHHRFVAHAATGTDDYHACLDLAEKAFGEACTGSVDHESFALSQSILFGGVRSALEYALGRPESETDSVRDHMLTMAMASIRVLAQGGGR